MELRKKLLLVTTSLIIVVVLCITILILYVKSYEVKISEYELIYKTNVDLTENQEKLAWFYYSEDKTYKYKYYPIFFDLLFLRPKSWGIPIITSSYMIDNRKYKSHMEFSLVWYATMRYLIRNIDWRICLEYNLSYSHFGNNTYGLNEAAMNNYGKKVAELSDLELIKLLLFTVSPTKYVQNVQLLNERAEEIYNEY